MMESAANGSPKLKRWERWLLAALCFLSDNTQPCTETRPVELDRGNSLGSDNALNRNSLFLPNKVAVRSAGGEIAQPSSSSLLDGLLTLPREVPRNQESSLPLPGLDSFPTFSKHQSLPMELANTPRSHLLSLRCEELYITSVKNEPREPRKIPWALFRRVTKGSIQAGL